MGAEMLGSFALSHKELKNFSARIGCNGKISVVNCVEYCLIKEEIGVFGAHELKKRKVLHLMQWRKIYCFIIL